MSDNREITDSRYGDDSRFDVKKNKNSFTKSTYSVTKEGEHVSTHKSRRDAVQKAEELSGDERP